jgi:anthranilate synthase component I
MKITTTATLAPVVRELPADLETPVSVYMKLAGQGPSFLLESVSGGENLARYSFIGAGPMRAYVLRGRRMEIHENGGMTAVELPTGTDPLDALRAELAPFRRPALPGLPRFSGGLVGFMGYEIVRFFEPTLPLAAHPDMPDAVFFLADTLVAFDHAFGKMVLIANPLPNANLAASRQAAEARLDALMARLDDPLPALKPADGVTPTPLRSNLTPEQYHLSVQKAKEHIAAGDIFQVVLSQRLSRQTSAHPFSVYRALRRLNPSPYMFFMDFSTLAGGEPLRLIGASPEVHVRLESGRAFIRPIAGTRPRGASPDEDNALEKELLADPKELAEHVMLVDLARNDLGRVCAYGSVHVPEQMVVERYSHVMHIVSQAEGNLCPDYDALDLLRATFPAGTVSGAPKIRAMQIVHALEDGPRGSYAGVAGYIGLDGSMDTCITIRTLVMRGQTVSVQAGAGIVADSDPEREYQESMNKARALALAVDRAEKTA